jgi:hypothetical protein
MSTQRRAADGAVGLDAVDLLDAYDSFDAYDDLSDLDVDALDELDVDLLVRALGLATAAAGRPARSAHRRRR